LAQGFISEKRMLVSLFSLLPLIGAANFSVSFAQWDDLHHGIASGLQANPYNKFSCAQRTRRSLHIGFLVRQDWVDKYGPDVDDMMRLIGEVVEDIASVAFAEQLNVHLRVQAVVFPNDAEFQTNPRHPLLTPVNILAGKECGPNTHKDLMRMFEPMDGTVPGGEPPISWFNAAAWYFLTTCHVKTKDNYDGAAYVGTIGGYKGPVVSAGQYAVGALNWPEDKVLAAENFAHQLGHTLGAVDELYGLMGPVGSKIRGVAQFDDVSKDALCKGITRARSNGQLWSPWSDPGYLPPDMPQPEDPSQPVTPVPVDPVPTPPPQPQPQHKDPRWCTKYVDLTSWCRSATVHRLCTDLCGQPVPRHEPRWCNNYKTESSKVYWCADSRVRSRCPQTCPPRRFLSPH